MILLAVTAKVNADRYTRTRDGAAHPRVGSSPHAQAETVVIFRAQRPRMIQGGEDFGFASKAGESVNIRGHRCWENLDGNLTFQLGIGCPIRLTHAPFADLRGDFVNTKTGAGSQGQVVVARRAQASAQRSAALAD
jgi:hypothetical protein